jgi:hypothetical protein
MHPLRPRANSASSLRPREGAAHLRVVAWEPGLALTRSIRIARAARASSCALALLFAQPSLALNAPEEESEAVEAASAPRSHSAASVRDPHDPSRALHPLRVVAYALHPVGVVLDWVLVRPAVWVARQEPFQTLFGFED